MKTIKRAVAGVELLLIFPAMLFMPALFLRNVQLQQYEPAHTAAQIVQWYAAGPVWLTLWVLLMALPLAVLVTGAATLLRSWKRDAEMRRAAWQMLDGIRAHLATLLVAAATLLAAGVPGDCRPACDNGLKAAVSIEPCWDRECPGQT